MIKIFDSNAKNFKTNGIIAIQPIEITEYKKISLNGWYLEVVVSSKYKEYILKDYLCVIDSKSKLSPQAFRIGNPEYDDEEIKFTANHVIFDSGNYFLIDVRPTDLSANNALNWINERTDNKSPFTFSSDVETIGTHYFEYKNLLEALSIIEEEWGGTYDIDNWNAKLVNSIGNDKGKLLIYQKNLEGLTIRESWDDVCTKLYGKGPNDLVLPEIYLESKIKYNQPYTKTITFESSLDESASEDEKIKELRSKMISYLENNSVPKVSYEISASSKFAIDNFDIGDIIHIKHPYVNLKVNVVEYTRNVNTGRMLSVVLGNYIPDVKQKVANIKESINKVASNLSSQEKVVKRQTELINSFGKKGYCLYGDNELLILDKLPKEEAKFVWRYNQAGWGFSENGYEGPFKLAATIDGVINADFIQTGSLDVNLIKGLEDLVFQAKNIKLEGYVSANGNVSIDKEGTGTFKNVKIEDGQLMLQDSNDDQSESIFIYNADSIETLYPSVKIGEKLNKLYFNFPDSMEPDKTGTNISKVPIVTFEYGYIYYNYGYQYSDYVNLWLYDSTTEEETIIYKLDNAFERIEVNLKELELPKSIGKIISIDNSYKNNDTLLSSYITNKVLNIKYYTKYASNGIEMKKDKVTSQYLANGVNITDSNGTRTFNENGICWMTSPGEDYKDFIVNKDIVSFNGNKLVEGLNIDKLNMVDQDSPYLEVSLLENVQGYSTYGINVWASDKRLKKNINESNVNALNLIKKIPHREFKYKNSETLTKIGYVADELESIDPQMIFESGPDKLKQPKVSYIVPLLSKAIQEQQNMIDNLVEKVELLERKVNENN